MVGGIPTANKKQTSAPRSNQPISNDVGSTSGTQKNQLTPSPSAGIFDSSIKKGTEAFKYILKGIDLKTFMTEKWEQQPLYIGGRDPHYYDTLKVSTMAIDEMLRSQIIEFTKNLDLTSYENGERQTHNPEGRAVPAAVWEEYANGRSVRKYHSAPLWLSSKSYIYLSVFLWFPLYSSGVINPQTFLPHLNKFNATLQEYFHCLVGANIYLTPPNSQGFAPHYDDIEAFVLQIEGQKEWSLYAPRSEAEILPRESSRNFSEDEIGEPCYKTILKPGDMLYFPRGWIHQAKTVENSHSLHITLSVYQKTSFADLLENVASQAVQSAIASNVELRKGVPFDIWNRFGETYAHCDSDHRRKEMKIKLKNMFEKVLDHLDFDKAVDKLAIKYQYDALPPVRFVMLFLCTILIRFFIPDSQVLSAAEKQLTTFGVKPLVQDNGQVDLPELEENSEVRLLRAHILRLGYQEGEHVVYYYADNSKEYHANEMNYVGLEDTSAEIVKKLIRAYPEYTKINQLSENIEEALSVVYVLFDRGLIMTSKPLN